MSHEAGTWRFDDRRPQEWSGPRPYQAGAAGNLAQGEPALVVYGTAGDETRTELLNKAAESIARCSGDWKSGKSFGRFPVKEVVHGHSLVERLGDPA